MRSSWIALGVLCALLAVFATDAFAQGAPGGPPRPPPGGPPGPPPGGMPPGPPPGMPPPGMPMGPPPPGFGPPGGIIIVVPMEVLNGMSVEDFEQHLEDMFEGVFGDVEVKLLEDLIDELPELPEGAMPGGLPFPDGFPELPEGFGPPGELPDLPEGFPQPGELPDFPDEWPDELPDFGELPDDFPFDLEDLFQGIDENLPEIPDDWPDFPGGGSGNPPDDMPEPPDGLPDMPGWDDLPDDLDDFFKNLNSLRN